MIGVYIVLFLAFTGRSYCISAEEDALLPRLFHVDDHDRCLLQPAGLYCLGEFDLAPVGHSPMYDNIQSYGLKYKGIFNRSRLYRGYCVSVRCPEKENNASLRFERCVDSRARRHALSAKLTKLQYCTTHQQHAAKTQQPPDTAQLIFLQIVYAILTLNIVGTVYDVVGDQKKMGIITAWSVRRSWRRLTASYDDGDPRLHQLESLQGMRVCATLIAIYSHTYVQRYQFYVTNPNFLEKLFHRVDGVLQYNGTSLMQLFVVISSFLTAYNMLLYAEKHRLSFWMLPVLVVKRTIRIGPVHLLTIGFGATYWSTFCSGSFSGVIAEYSASCRRKFWSHVFFINNMVEKHDNTCLMPTWFLAVDMHLFIVSCALTIIMCRRRHQALYLYAALFVISTAASGIIAYIKGYRTLIHETEPEKLRGLYAKSESFGGFYISTWGTLPGCFAGLFLAHLHHDLQLVKYDWKQNQWVKRLYLWTIPVGLSMTLASGLTLRDYTQPWIPAAFLAIERPLLSCLVVGYIIGYINTDVAQRRFFEWRGWRVPARLSLSVMLVHWLVNVLLAARTPAYHTSIFDVSVDYLATVFYGYLLAVPIAILVEIPVQRFFAQFF